MKNRIFCISLTKQNFLQKELLYLLRNFIIIMPFAESKGHKKSLLWSRLRIFYIQQGLFTVHPCFFGKQSFFFLLVVRIRHTAIHRTNRGALWFFMKTNALRTFI